MNDKKAYIITGLGSTGSVFISKVIAHAVGATKHIDDWDGYGYCKSILSNIKILHRSQPYTNATKYCNLKEFKKELQDYNLIFIIPTRYHEISSMSIKHRFKWSNTDIKNSLTKSSLILTEIIKNNEKYFIWNYETMLYLNETYFDLLYNFLESNIKYYPKIVDGNIKYITPVLNFIGQKGQDKWIIKKIFNYKRNGYFIDLAASDGIKINNTLLLEKKLNWKGICIEPNPIFYKNLLQNRKCHTIDYVIDYKNDNEIEFRIDNGELGGIISNDTDNNYEVRFEELKNAKIIKLKTKTLEYVLDKFKAPNIIDYLSLDVEGAEERVLLNFPFNKYTFLALTIERPTEKLEKKLFENNYIFVKKSRFPKRHHLADEETFDSFYIHKSIPNFDNIMKEKYSPTQKKEW